MSNFIHFVHCAIVSAAAVTCSVVFAAVCVWPAVTCSVVCCSACSVSCSRCHGPSTWRSSTARCSSSSASFSPAPCRRSYPLYSSLRCQSQAYAGSHAYAGTLNGYINALKDACMGVVLYVNVLIGLRCTVDLDTSRSLLKRRKCCTSAWTT